MAIFIKKNLLVVCFKLFCVENKLLLARIFYEVNNSIIILLEKKVIVCIFVCKKVIFKRKHCHLIG